MIRRERFSLRCEPHVQHQVPNVPLHFFHLSRFGVMRFTEIESKAGHLLHHYGTWWHDVLYDVLYEVFFAQKLPKVPAVRKVCSSALKEVLDRYRLAHGLIVIRKIDEPPRTTNTIIHDRLETPFLDSVSHGFEKKHAEYSKGLPVGV